MTVRNNICENLISRFINASIIDPAISQRYKYCTREAMCQGMIDSILPGEAAISLFEGSETKNIRQFNSTDCDLPLTFEVYYKTKQSERDWKTRQISSKLNTILGEVIRLVLYDPQCENNALNIYEESNRIDIDGIYDDTVGLEVTFVVKYRHLINDPTKRI